MKRIWKTILGILILLLAGGAVAWFGFLRPDPPPISEKDLPQLTLMPLPSDL